MDITQIIADALGYNKALPRKSYYAKDWLSWYRGKVMGFHNYRIYNGSNYLDMERKTMGLPKFVAETWANLLLNERCDIVLPDDEKQKLDYILYRTNFWQKANEGVEKSFALGYGALVMSVKDLQVGQDTGKINKEQAYICVDFVNETKIYPITTENKEITECAFVSTGSDYTNYAVHIKDENGIYQIHSYVLNDKSELVSHEVFNTNSMIAWFFILRPNISSNFLTEMSDDELGVSIYANCLDNFKAIDNKYDGFDLEYVLGRKRMFVSTEAWTINKNDGQITRTFDPYDTLFYHLPDNSEGKPIITTSQDGIRYDAYVKGINTEMSYIAMKCGLGENFLKFDGSMVATATQVVAENSSLFRNIKKHQILIEEVLIRMTKAIINASNDFTEVIFNPLEDFDIKIKFDDSIFEDKGSEMDRDRLDVQAGILSVPEYREKWYGETEEEAVAHYQDYFLNKIIDSYLSALTSGAITPAQYVEKVFVNAPNKEEIVQYITDFMGKQQPDMQDVLYAGNETGNNEGEEVNEEETVKQEETIEEEEQEDSEEQQEEGEDSEEELQDQEEKEINK
jgi:A118 family predicted phage portal protein